MQELHKVNLSRIPPCDQYGTDMKQMGEKRLCEKCEKHITDFRKMSNRDIALAHAKSETAFCGLYRPEQLSLTTSKSAKKAWVPVASFVSLLSLLSPNNGQGQSVEVKTPVEQTLAISGNELKEMEDSSVQSTARQDSISISGKATHYSEKGEGEPIPFATIIVKGTEIGANTDVDGNYSLDISEVPESLSEISLVFNYIGMTRQEIHVLNQAMNDVNFNTVADVDRIAYTVMIKKPPLHKRVWWKLSQPFRK